MDRTPFDVDELRKNLFYWSRLDVVETTGSTNADLLARAPGPAFDRAVLLAEHQTGGRGRHGRAWVTPPRAQVALSVAVTLPGIAPEAIGWLPLLAGVATVDAVRETARVDAALKWPNDILSQPDGRKLAGILAEVAPPVGGTVNVVVGIGLNTTLTDDELPVPHATSLALAGAEVTDRTPIAAAMLRTLADRLADWQKSAWDTTQLATDYRTRCATLGEQVRAELPGDTVLEGEAVDVDAAGRLVIATATGRVAVSAGDVTHLRRG